MRAKTNPAIKYYQDATLRNATQEDTAINLTIRPAMTLLLNKGITRIIILSGGSVQISVRLRRVHNCMCITNLAKLAP